MIAPPQVNASMNTLDGASRNNSYLSVVPMGAEFMMGTLDNKTLRSFLLMKSVKLSVWNDSAGSCLVLEILTV